MSWPEAVARQYACKMFATMPPGVSVIAIEQGPARLEVSFEANEVPNVGVWINRRGWSPLKRAKPYANLAFEPCIGAPDSLANALLQPWDSAHWLAPGAERTWTLYWRTAPSRAQQFSPR
jgi:galactose mutarotase-like enzyme